MEATPPDIRADGGEKLEIEKLLNFSCAMGRDLLQNGAEIYRVEESIERILQAYGCGALEVFAIPACIIVNIQDGERNYTKSVRIRSAANNLRKLSNLNALCRELCREVPPVDEAFRRLAEVMEEPCYPAWTGYLAHGLVALFFTLFWGGNWLDGLAAFPCGLIVKYTVSAMRGVRANVFFTNLAASALLALEPLTLQWAGLPVQTDKIIIGSIMLLVPGIAITNVMRDILAGDFLTALTRFAEVLIVAVGIALGAAVAMMAFRALAGL